MRVVCCQFDIAWENKAANFARIGSLLEATPPQVGSLLLLPETFATGFTPNIAAFAEEPGGPTGQFLAKISVRYQIHVVAGVIEKGRNGEIYNRAVVFDSAGRPVAQYTKLHPFGPGGEATEPGSGIVGFGWGAMSVWPFICYDLRFPEIFRRAVIGGAHLLVVLACWPKSRQAHWDVLLRARAIENQCFVAGVNRCGIDPKLAYGGGSTILDPRGQCLVDAGESAGLFSAELDLESLLAYRREFPVLADIRDEFFVSLPLRP